MGLVHSLPNTFVVQAFKHLPWLASRWARRHQFVEGREIPWTPVRKPMAESMIAFVTTAGVHLKSQEPFDMEDPDPSPAEDWKQHGAKDSQTPGLWSNSAHRWKYTGLQKSRQQPYRRPPPKSCHEISGRNEAIAALE